jgi:hypothetical protein
MTRADNELRSKALSVSIVGDLATLSVDVLVAELARCYELPVESLECHRLNPDNCLLVFPDEDMATRVYNEGCPMQLPPFTLCFRRWSRMKNATAVVLPSLINIKLSSIPAHAWELETVEHLLNEWCGKEAHGQRRSSKEGGHMTMMDHIT